jgi:hypothetical protein
MRQNKLYKIIRRKLLWKTETGLSDIILQFRWLIMLSRASMIVSNLYLCSALRLRVFKITCFLLQNSQFLSRKFYGIWLLEGNGNVYCLMPKKCIDVQGADVTVL